MRKVYDQHEDETEVNLTPMLDVVFIMLIFFIVTSSFVKEAGVEVNRPDAFTAERKPLGNILIAITESGDIWVDKRRVDERSLRSTIERLHSENPQGTVVIQADKNSTHRPLLAVMDAARLAGVSSTALSAELTD